MYPTSQPAALVNSPVLRITHRQRQPAGPIATAPFEWYLCPQAGAFSHLVLVAGQQQLGHWVLPAAGCGPAEPPAGLWMQVAPEVGLARPVAHEASCQGTGAAISRGSTAPAPAELVLHLPAPDGLRQVYWLRQLRPGSPSWLLSRGRPHRRLY